MNCPKCNGKVSEKKQCPFCGMDLSIYKKISSLSNYYYNIGLEKAKIRDLSGAITVLKKSLELNKKNTHARNLLGLIHFEMGETVDALSSWVISKHFQPENNEADRYMKTIQKNANKLDTLNQAIKKYNLALEESQNGNYDVAMIQLKKACSINPNFVKAGQLLALLHLKVGEKEKARRILERVKKIDIANTMTYKYLEACGGKDSLEASQEMRKERSEKVLERDPNVAFMPVSTYKEERTNVKSWINLVIGAVLGIACGYFLFVPAAKRAVHQEYKVESTDLDSKVSVYTAQIHSLENDNSKLTEQVKSLQEQLDSIKIPEYDEKMYDNLFVAVNLYIEELSKKESQRDLRAIAKKLSDLKESALDNKAASKLYKTLKGETYEKVANQLWEEGHASYLAGKYDEALDTLLEAYDYNKDNADVIYFIGRTYHRLGENDKAKKYYNKIIKHFSDTNRYSEAKIRLAELGD